MQKLFILLLSFMMLFTSSCTMKNMLWDYLDIEGAIPAKALASSLENRVDASVSLLELCSAKSGSLFGGTEVIPAASIKAPLLLFFALIFLPWAIFGMFQPKTHSHTYLQYPFPHPVPIYLKLGRLIYYS